MKDAYQKAFEQMIEDAFNPEIDDTGDFYQRVANDLVRPILTKEEAELCFHVRRMAIEVLNHVGYHIKLQNCLPVIASAWSIAQLDELATRAEEQKVH